jgi:hypothetical protein
MITSKITGKTYDPINAIYMTNYVQCQKYFTYLGHEPFLDIIYTSEERPDVLVFVWKRCPETKQAKELWDNHKL